VQPEKGGGRFKWTRLSVLHPLAAPKPAGRRRAEGLAKPGAVRRAATNSHTPEIIVMSQTIGKANASAPSPARTGARAPHTDKEQADYQRRLRAAGIKEDECPENMDAFRLQLARQIAMFLNHWHGCKERLCRRNRGCMAPDIHCANVEQPSPEQRARDWPKLQYEVYTALKAEIARRGLEDA
jgi:hypothetical protein